MTENNNALDRAAADAQAVMRSTRTWDPETEPTSEKWAAWFQKLAPEYAEAVARYLLLRMASDDQCYLAGHTGVIESLEATVGRLQTENRQLRTSIRGMRADVE